MASAVRPEVQEARRAREELGVGLTGPLDDALRVIEEEAGLPVAVLELPDELAGLYRRRKDQGLVLINGRQAVVRQRFTLAHEFGHARLGHGTVVDRPEDIFGRSHDPQEVQANYFAGEFLAPRPAVMAWLEARGDPKVDLETVVRFACRFGLSAMAARVRFETAAVIKRTKARDLDKQIDEGKHRELKKRLGLTEARDTLSANELPRIPTAMQGRARRIYEAGLLDLAEIAARTGQDPSVLEEEFAPATPVHPEDDF